jgi:hypothetical protein
MGDGSKRGSNSWKWESSPQTQEIQLHSQAVNHFTTDFGTQVSVTALLTCLFLLTELDLSGSCVPGTDAELIGQINSKL